MEKGADLMHSGKERSNFVYFLGKKVWLNHCWTVVPFHIPMVDHGQKHGYSKVYHGQPWFDYGMTMVDHG